MPNLRWRTIPKVGDFWGVGVEPHELSSEGDPSWNSVTLRRKDARCASCTLSSSPVVLLCSRRCTSRGSDDGGAGLRLQGGALRLLGCWESSFPDVESCLARDPPMAAHHALMLCYSAAVAADPAGATSPPLRLQVRPVGFRRKAPATVALSPLRCVVPES